MIFTAIEAKKKKNGLVTKILERIISNLPSLGINF